LILVILAACLTTGGFVAACASQEARTAAKPQEEKVYVTGSRIPVRSGGTSAAVRSIDNREAAGIINDHSGIYIPPKTGSGN